VTAHSSRVERSRAGAEYLASLGSRRLLIIAVVSTLLATVIGALVVPMFLRPAVTAETRLVVGNQTLGAQRVPGYASATVTPAETYARFITMEQVTKAQSATLSDVQATVIPNNPVIRIEVTAGNAKDARSGAAAAARDLVVAVNQVSGNTIDASQQMYLQKRTASDQAQGVVDQLTTQVKGTLHPSAKLLADQQSAIINASLARIESDAYVTIVRNELMDGTTQSAGLTIIMAPLVTATDKRPMMLGALLGGGLAILIWAGVSIVGQARRREQGSPAR
jgi:hypothetical protein